MERVRDPSPSSSNDSQRKARENQKKKMTRVTIRALVRAGFSDSFPHHDKTRSLSEDGIAEGESLSRGFLEDCSTSSGSERASKTSTSNSCVESETVSPKASTSGSEHHPNSVVSVHWRDLLSVFRKGPLDRKHAFPHLKKGVPKLTRRKSRRIREEMVPPLNCLDSDICYLKPSWKNYSLSEIQAATDNFSSENLIGEGGYAEVYKGKLGDGQLVAIKRLTRGSPEDMTVDFLSELGIIVHVDHPNIARLVGYGVEGGMHLVLELSAHGSLATLLYGPREILDWGKRHKIVVGTAKGLLYLHEGCQRRIIHKDIKASNILLTEDFEPQISDFGLSKWLPEQWTHHTVSKVEGTFGYLPPEFFMHGIVDEKTDVYAYGVLLLELITGRQAVDSSQQSLVMWAKPLLKKNSIKELVDPTLVDSYDPKQMDLIILTASMCINQASAQRPLMSQVVQILNGEEGCLEKLKRLQSAKLQRTYSEELMDAEEYNSTKYLSDMNRHMEAILGDYDETSEEYSLAMFSDNQKQIETILD